MRAGSALLILLLALSVGAFALTRVLRSSDDVVNTVVLAAAPKPGGKATIRFTTTQTDSQGAVYIIDSHEETVRTLRAPGTLAAGPHTLRWDGRTDAGTAAPPGRYGLRVVLGADGRDIVPPGSITIGPAGAESASSGFPGESSYEGGSG